MAAREAAWLKKICYDLNIPTGEPLTLYADNQAAIHVSNYNADSGKTKHIDIAHHFLRNAVARRVIKLEYTSTEDNAADMFTKPMSEAKLKKFKSMVGMT